MNLNVYVGRLTKDVAVDQVNNSEVAKFTLAVKREYRNAEGSYDADFIPVEAWNNYANIAKKYLKKGTLVGVTGRLETNYVNERNFFKLVVSKFELLPNGKGEEKNSTSVLDQLPPYF